MAKRLMIDFETLSLRKNAVLLCMGAVVFDEQNECLDHKVWHLNLETQSDVLRRHIDPETVLWWMQQSSEAQARVFVPTSERVHIATFLQQLHDLVFWNEIAEVWSKGPAADAAWLESLCHDMQMKCPISYRAFMDVRTEVRGMPRLEPGPDIVEHDPVSDCVHQVRELHAVWSN